MMKLAHSPASPYVRKCMACAIARGIEDRIERWTLPPMARSMPPAA